jgi:DNA-binding NarL/FixJ family response regulator
MAKKPPAKPAKPGAPHEKKVLVVDDHPVFRAGLIGLLQHEPDLTVCGEAGDAARTIAAVEKLRPDLVLLDMGLPDRSGLELLKDLHALCPGLPVLIISMHDETLYAERVLRAGGRGYIMKQAGPEKIIDAVRKILGGGTYVSERISTLIVQNISGRRTDDPSSSVSRLTDRELEILRLIGEGREAQDIASHLHLSIKTVDTHRAHIHYAARWADGQP